MIIVIIRMAKEMITIMKRIVHQFPEEAMSKIDTNLKQPNGDLLPHRCGQVFLNGLEVASLETVLLLQEEQVVQNAIIV